MTEPEDGEFPLLSDGRVEALLQIASNHPLREEQLTGLLSMNQSLPDALDTIRKLLDENLPREEEYEGKRFYRGGESRHIHS